MASFSKNVLKLSVGDVTAQAISLATMPMITRIYTPENYGIFSIYFAVTMMLYPISNLHFHDAMILPEKEEDAFNMLFLSVFSVVGFSILTSIVIFFLKHCILVPRGFTLKGFIDYLWLIPVGILIQGNLAVFIQWALRQKDFGKMASARVSASINDRAITLIAGYFADAGAIGLIGGRIVGPFAALCVLFYQTVIKRAQFLWEKLSFSEMKRLAIRYREFCTFSILSDLVINASREAPLILLPLFFSPVITGYYALAMRVVNLPMKLVGDAISKVFLRRAAGDQKKGEQLLKDTKNLFGFLIYFSAPPILIILCMGKALFVVVFGSEWEVSGTYTQILVLSFLGMFLYRPLSTLFVAFERQRQRLMVSAFLFLARAGSIVITAFLFKSSIYVTLLALAISTCSVYVGAYIYIFGMLGLNAIGVFQIFMGKAVILIPVVAGSFLSRSLLGENNLMAALILLGAILIQATVIVMSEPKLKKKFRSGIFSK